MKKTTLTITVVLTILLAFGTGVYAAKWLNFEGDNQVVETSAHIDEILDILERVNADKITAEEALEELENSNNERYQDLIDKIDELHQVIGEKDRIIVELQEELQQAESDKQYIKHLENELKRANKKVEQLNGKSSKALEQAKKIVGDDE